MVLTSTGERKVTVRSIGPVVMLKMDCVGVIRILVTFANLVRSFSSPDSQEYVMSSMRILLNHPRCASLYPKHKSQRDSG